MTIEPESTRRIASYTLVRPDIVSIVPLDAKYVLDVGCSNGALGRYLKSQNSDREVYGIEMDPELGSEAAEILDRVVIADVSQLDIDVEFRGKKFDCVIFADVLEHLADPETTLRSATRSLAAGGKMVVSLPNIRHATALWNIYIMGTFPRRSRGIFDSTHLRWFTRRDAMAMFQTCGMRVIAETATLRKGDVGGGRVNRIMNRLPVGIRRFALVREFFAYQYCFLLEKVGELVDQGG